MLQKVFEATAQNPLKNYFVKICEKYLQRLEINLSFEEIEKMSKMSFKKLVKEKTKEVFSIEIFDSAKEQPIKNLNNEL